jgi:hypothetical protein
MRPGNLASHEIVTNKAIHRFFRDLENDAVAMLLVSLADHLTYLKPSDRGKKKSSHEKITVKMIHAYYHERKTILPEKLLSGHEIMKSLKLQPSKLIGLLLKDLQEAQTENKITTKKDALAYLKNRVEYHQKSLLSA